MTNLNNRQAHINGLIDEVAASEKITKVKLALISRDILSYVMDSDDIASVNRLIGVLTPVNKRVAILYFQAMLPWDVERNTEGAFQRFGKKTKADKKIKKAQETIDAFLSDPENDIWLWASTNVEVEPKKKDFSGMIQRIVKQALVGDEKSGTDALDPMAIIAAVFAGGVNLDDVLLAVETEQLKADAEAELQASIEALMAQGEAEEQQETQAA